MDDTAAPSTYMQTSRAAGQRGKFTLGGGFLTGERMTRRLAAILAADVVGYSRLMGRDENGTLARFKGHMTERFEPTLARHGGRLVKLTGDGALVEFTSALGALGAAVEFQQAMADANRDQATDAAMVFRIGVHLGDLIVEDDDIHGDGVNIAVRLEAQAPPGGIVVSRTVHEAVAGRLKATFEDLGTLALKNIERPIQAYRVAWESADWPVSERATTANPMPTDGPPPLPDKPSIAVLPFQNMSGDPEQEYFVDGLVEEIITGLSHSKALFVIARNSSFTYKGRAVDVRQVGRELGVRYVLEGSVRKAGNRLRITGQLVEAANGVHLWADRFDGDLADIFELQDQITTQVIGAIAPRLELAEIERARRKTTGLGRHLSLLQGRFAGSAGLAGKGHRAGSRICPCLCHPGGLLLHKTGIFLEPRSRTRGCRSRADGSASNGAGFERRAGIDLLCANADLQCWPAR
jgi:adenylate cyclase